MRFPQQSPTDYICLHDSRRPWECTVDQRVNESTWRTGLSESCSRRN
jgi:hypothetical protein